MAIWILALLTWGRLLGSLLRLSAPSAQLSVEEAITRFLDVRAPRVADGTLDCYRRQLATWQRWREHRSEPALLRDVALDEFDRFFRYLAEEHLPHGNNPRRPAAAKRGMSLETQLAYWRVLSGLWAFAGRRRWLDEDQRAYFGRDGIPRPTVELVARPVYETELATMLDACGDGDDEESARDRALVALLYESGARIGDALNIDDDMVDAEHRRARDVPTKGGHRHTLRWGPVARHELLRYLQRRRGKRGGRLPLFRASGPEAGSGTRLSTDTARARFERQLEAAGIEPIDGSPFHALRRGFIQRALDAGVPLPTVSQLANHKDVRTTARYDKRDDANLDAAFDRLYNRTSHPPAPEADEDPDANTNPDMP